LTCEGQALDRTPDWLVMTVDGDVSGALPPGDNALEILQNTAKINILRLHDKKHGRLRCRSCGKTWVVHYKSFHYGLRTPVVKIERARDLLNAGFSIRRIAEIGKISENKTF